MTKKWSTNRLGNWAFRSTNRRLRLWDELPVMSPPVPLCRFKSDMAMRSAPHNPFHSGCRLTMVRHARVAPGPKGGKMKAKASYLALIKASKTVVALALPPACNKNCTNASVQGAVASWAACTTAMVGPNNLCAAAHMAQTNTPCPPVRVVATRAGSMGGSLTSGILIPLGVCPGGAKFK
eukprot:scaffold4511_cov171-Amphora_coffeaeformis.AAC.22